MINYLYPCRAGDLIVSNFLPQVSNSGNITSSKLPFRPTIDDDGKELVCRAENAQVSEGVLEDRRTLTVRCEYTDVYLGDMNQSLPDNQSVAFHCYVTQKNVNITILCLELQQFYTLIFTYTACRICVIRKRLASYECIDTFISVAWHQQCSASTCNPSRYPTGFSVCSRMSRISRYLVAFLSAGIFSRSVACGDGRRRGRCATGDGRRAAGGGRRAADGGRCRRRWVRGER